MEVLTSASPTVNDNPNLDFTAEDSIHITVNPLDPKFSFSISTYFTDDLDLGPTALLLNT